MGVVDLISSVISILGGIGGLIFLGERLWRRFFIPRPHFRTLVGIRPPARSGELIMDIVLKNVSSVDAHDLKCYVHVLEEEGGKDVTMIPLVFDTPLLKAGSYREATCSGQYAETEPGKNYLIKFTISCSELGEKKWLDEVHLTSF